MFRHSLLPCRLRNYTLFHHLRSRTYGQLIFLIVTREAQYAKILLKNDYLQQKLKCLDYQLLGSLQSQFALRVPGLLIIPTAHFRLTRLT